MASLIDTKVQNVDVSVLGGYREDKHGPIFQILQSVFPDATGVDIFLDCDMGYLAATFRPPNNLKYFSSKTDDDNHGRSYVLRRAESSVQMPFENLGGLEGLRCPPFLLLWLFSQWHCSLPNLTSLVIEDAHYGCSETFWRNLLRFAPNITKIGLYCYIVGDLRELLRVSHSKMSVRTQSLI